MTHKSELGTYILENYGPDDDCTNIRGVYPRGRARLCVVPNQTGSLTRRCFKEGDYDGPPASTLRFCVHRTKILVAFGDYRNDYMESQARGNRVGRPTFEQPLTLDPDGDAEYGNRDEENERDINRQHRQFREVAEHRG